MFFLFGCSRASLHNRSKYSLYTLYKVQCLSSLSACLDNQGWYCSWCTISLQTVQKGDDAENVMGLASLSWCGAQICHTLCPCIGDLVIIPPRGGFSLDDKYCGAVTGWGTSLSHHNNIRCRINMNQLIEGRLEIEQEILFCTDVYPTLLEVHGRDVFPPWEEPGSQDVQSSTHCC